MKEAEPGHYENTPCAGKQFLDPEGFEYKLELNHPCLYKLYMVFLCIIGLLMFLLFLTLPCTMFIFSFFNIAYMDLDEDFQKLKSSIKFILFLTRVFIANCRPKLWLYDIRIFFGNYMLCYCDYIFVSYF